MYHCILPAFVNRTKWCSINFLNKNPHKLEECVWALFGPSVPLQQSNNSTLGSTDEPDTQSSSADFFNVRTLLQHFWLSFVKQYIYIYLYIYSVHTHSTKGCWILHEQCKLGSRAQTCQSIWRARQVCSSVCNHWLYIKMDNVRVLPKVKPTCVAAGCSTGHISCPSLPDWPNPKLKVYFK